MGGYEAKQAFVYRVGIKGKDVAARLNYVIEATGGKERVKTETIAVTVTTDNKAPRVKHEHITNARAGAAVAANSLLDRPRILEAAHQAATELDKVQIRGLFQIPFESLLRIRTKIIKLARNYLAKLVRLV